MRLHHLALISICFLGVAVSLGSCAPAGSQPPLPTAAALAVLPSPTLTTTPIPAIPTPTSTAAPLPTAAAPSPTPTAVTPSPTPPPTAVPWREEITYGFSLLERPLRAVRLGSGPRTVVFIGGMHGGYEWNTIWLAYEALDYFSATPDAVPPEVALYLIPSANPDGQFTVTFKDGRVEPADIPAGIDTSWGRFNGNGVDLNRNWDCDWAPIAQWQDRVVSGGDAPFSEPESAALRDFLLALNPAAVVFWHSAADAIYSARCGDPFQPSRELAAVYGGGSGYRLAEGFPAYPVTGDAADWLAGQGIPAITVELATHETLEWERNLGGMTAVLAAAAAAGEGE